MRIAVIGPTHPFRGGLAHYTTLLVHHLRTHHDVRFYSYRRQYPAWLFPGNTAPDPSKQHVVEACERTIDGMNPLTWWATARRIVADRPDVILLQWWTPFWIPLHAVVSFYAKRAGIPVLFLCHQFVEPDSSLTEWFIARFGLRDGSGYIVITEEECIMARRAFRTRPIRAGHLPICDGLPQQHISREAARAQFGIDPDVPLLLFFGFVRRYKGLSYLLQALGSIERPVHLLVAGEFWENEQEHRATIQQLGLDGRVFLHNRYIPNEDIEPYFAAADALVLPYLNGSQSGVGMIAVNYALPVIASNVGGLAETIVHNQTGLIVPPGDSDALAAAIERFFGEHLHEQFRHTMEHSRERLSWEALIRIIEELSHEVLEAKNT